jgi:pimeloyl-ACP methyl ester carboxylesterase
VLKGLGGEYVLLVGAYKGAQTPQDAAVHHLQREAKEFQLKELGAGSHFVPMEHPDLVLKEIRNFID